MTRRTPACRVTTVRRASVWLTRAPAPAWTEALPARAAREAAPARSAGTASCGKRATGTDKAGTDTVAAPGSTTARIVATPNVAYGSDMAARPTMPNQNRWRRVPNPIGNATPRAWWGPANAGVRPLRNNLQPLQLIPLPRPAVDTAERFCS